jgi:hypothetical protein
VCCFDGIADFERRDGTKALPEVTEEDDEEDEEEEEEGKEDEKHEAHAGRGSGRKRR